MRKLVADGRDFGSLTVSEWRQASDSFDADIVTRVTARISVARQADTSIDGTRRGGCRTGRGPAVAVPERQPDLSVDGIATRNKLC